MSSKIADKIFLNGSIHSMDSKNHVYSAIALSGDRILALGPDEEILELRAPHTQIIDLAGRTVIPGLIETHAHLFWVGLSELDGEVYVPESVSELLEYTRDKAKTLPKGEWIYFRNTYPTRLKEYRYPTIEELDSAAPDNPVFVDGAYAGQANSCALRLAGIDENTPQPPVGIIGKDEKTGKLTGLLFRCTQLIKAHRKLPVPEVEQYKQGIRNMQRNYNSLAITSVIEGMSDEKGVIAVNELYRQGELNLRTVYTLVVSSKETAESQLKDFTALVETPAEWGKFSFCKAMIDGGILTGTAYMREPYHDDIGVFGIEFDNFRGVINYNSRELAEYIRITCRTGLQMTAHCIGDGAIDVFLDAYEQCNKEESINEKRFSIIHCDFTDCETLNRIKRLGLCVLFQPAWHYMDAAVLTKVLGKRAIDAFLPYREFADMGIKAASGSDHMVKYDSFLSQNPYNPFLAMYNMVTRKTREGVVVGPEHRVTRDEALRMYTNNGAYVTFDEELKGSLEIGKAADFAVLSTDYFSCSEDDIKGITSLLTVVGGKIVYKAIKEYGDEL